jgi:hypothetical protein
MKKYVISPVTTLDFTKGKEYEVLAEDFNNSRFFTKDNNGHIRNCFYKNSETIDFNDWQIIEK